MIQPLPIEKYRNTYDPAKIKCASTEEMRPLEEIIGQERALRALRFGLEIKQPGFNVYAAGAQGTGRKTAVQSFLGQLRKEKPRADDWIYVHNFENSYEPNAIRMPPGMGEPFKKDMARFIEEAKRTLPKVFQSEEYATRRDEMLGSLQAKRNDLLAQMNQRAAEKGFLIQPSPAGILAIPIVNGQPLPQEEFLNLPPEQREEIQRRREVLNADFRDVSRQIQEIERQGAEAVENLNREVTLYAIGHLLTDLKEKYTEIEEISHYIEAVQKDILDNLEIFLGIPQQQQQVPFQLQAMMQQLQEQIFRKYEVNVIVDNSNDGGAPVVYEQNPTYQNLFGKVEKEVQLGALTTDFTMIRPGSIHKANGGYLLLNVEDLFRIPRAHF